MAENLLANSIEFNYLTTAASFQFLTDQETRLLASAKIVEVLQPQLTTLRSALAFFDAELKRSAKNLKTDDITDADNNLDHAYTGFKEVVRTMALYPPTEELRMAIKRVNQKIKDFNIDVTIDMSAELSLIYNLLIDLEGLLSADITLMGLTPWVVRLRSCYETLHTLLFERTNENAVLAPRQLTQARLAAEDAYRKLIQMLNAHILIEGDAEYSDCVVLLNGEVTHYNQTIIARRKPAGSGSSSGSSNSNAGAGTGTGNSGNSGANGQNGSEGTTEPGSQGGSTGGDNSGSTGGDNGGSTGGNNGGSTGGDNGGSSGGDDNGGGGGSDWGNGSDE